MTLRSYAFLDLRYQLGRQVLETMILTRVACDLLEQYRFGVCSKRLGAAWHHVPARKFFHGALILR